VLINPATFALGTPIRFQEAFGARVFRQGKPRAVLEIKSPDIPPEIYEARLRGYDRAKAAKDPHHHSKVSPDPP
jgi:hypothetical protein